MKLEQRIMFQTVLDWIRTAFGEKEFQQLEIAPKTDITETMITKITEDVYWIWSLFSSLSPFTTNKKTTFRFLIHSVCTSQINELLL